MRTPLIALLAMVLASEARAFDVFTCGLVVPAGQVGNLVADVSCPGTLEAGVYLQKGARLLLNGHRILGGGGERFGVRCVGSCTVTGPGEIGHFDYGISESSGKKVTVSDVEVHHCERGIVAKHVQATNVFAHHHAEYAFSVGTRMRGIGVTAEDNGVFGFFGPKLVLEDSAMRRNGMHAVSAAKQFKGTNVTFEDNVGAAVVGGNIKATNLTATGNGSGVVGYPSLLLRDSTLVGNTSSDVSSERPPKLIDTVCEKSSQISSVGNPSGATWGVCTED